MLSNIDYASRAKNERLNMYFVAEGDSDYNVRMQTVVPANPTCNCYSVAKLFTVLAIGILYDRGCLSPNDKIIDILGDKFDKDYDNNWNEVTVHHAMVHRIGIETDCIDIDSETGETYPDNLDYLKLLFSKPLPNKPGSFYKYTDAAFYLLSRVVERVSGLNPSELLRPILMDVMGFKEFAWSVCPQGYCIGATGLYVRTDDLVKLGILFLNEGNWQGTRVISKKWIDLVLKEGYEIHPIGNGWYHKAGMRGQIIAFNPNLKRAIAWHSFDGIPFEKIVLE